MSYLIKWILYLKILLSLASCSSLALLGSPPKVDLCMLRVKSNENGTLTVDGRCKNQKDIKFTLPITKMDKYVCIAPNQFVDAMTYVDKVISTLRTEMTK